MDLFSFDFSLIFNVQCLLAICFGTLFGLFIGALPGLGPTVGVALLLPMVYTMEPITAIVMLVALYQAAEYGGSISSIVLGIPGTAAAVPTLFDGNALAKQGYPGKALGYSLTASTIGGIVGVIVLMTLTIPLAEITYKLSDPELFLIAAFGLISITSLNTTNVPKTVVSILFGLLLGTIGLDTFSGTARFTMGLPILYDGFILVPIITGLFAIAEVLNMVMSDLSTRYVSNTKNLKTHISFKEFMYILPTTIKSSIIGVLFGIVPGLGGGVGAWFTYTEAKRASKNPEKFGKGEPIGIAAPESANNAVVGGALIPFLTLGIPGSSTIAVVASAFIIHGIQPGPAVFQNNPELVYGIFWGLLIATIAMYVFGIYTTSLWARLLVIPNYILVPIVLVTSLIGAYATRNNFFDVGVAIVFGIIGFFIKKLDYSVPGFILAFILAYLFEGSFRRSLMISQGNYSIFITRPFCIVMIALIVLMVGSKLFQIIKAKKKATEIEA
ncbi:MAG: tripartite tricarboxylate transporter permease [Clostridia bacterium]